MSEIIIMYRTEYLEQGPTILEDTTTANALDYRNNDEFIYS